MKVALDEQVRILVCERYVEKRESGIDCCECFRTLVDAVTNLRNPIGGVCAFVHAYQYPAIELIFPEKIQAVWVLMDMGRSKRSKNRARRAVQRGDEAPKAKKVRNPLGKISGVTARELYKFAKSKGFRELNRRGKGSHIVMAKDGHQNVIIPNPNQGAQWCGRDVVRVTIKAIMGAKVVS